MKAVMYSKFGKPADVLELMEVESPRTEDRAVKIQVLFANINYSDLITVKGEYAARPVLPAGAGIEGIGEVLETGFSVNQPIRPGTKVCFHTRTGAWAEEITVTPDELIVLPENIDLHTGAQFFTNPLTADVMLSESGAREGDQVLINAAGSAVGKLLAQFALLRGLKPVAIVRNDSANEFLQKAGVEFIVNSEKENLINRIRTISGGKGIPIVFDAVAGKLSSELILSMAEGGRMILYGALSKERIPLNATPVIFRDITIKGFWLSKWLRRFGEDRREELHAYQESLIRKMIDNKIHLPVEATYPPEAIREAVTHFETPGRKGKILIGFQ